MRRMSIFLCERSSTCVSLPLPPAGRPPFPLKYTGFRSKCYSGSSYHFCISIRQPLRTAVAGMFSQWGKSLWGVASGGSAEVQGEKQSRGALGVLVLCSPPHGKGVGLTALHLQKATGELGPGFSYSPVITCLLFTWEFPCSLKICSSFNCLARHIVLLCGYASLHGRKSWGLYCD